MQPLTIDQIAQLAANAGFSGQDLATAVSIALAESGGHADAYNPERAAGAAQGKGSYGLWQIYITAHPEFSAAELIQPDYNAAAAFAVYTQAGHSFKPWSTFKNGAYLAHMDAVNAVIFPPADPQTQVADNSGNPADPGSDAGVGFSPNGTDTLLMFAIGAGLLWWLYR